MNTFMAIMSQLFWGVTVGALEAAFATLARGAFAVFGLGGAGWWLLRRRREKRDPKD
ncbi:hypothetical protein [Novosphingobium organovorum]|nr:hypothetical protein [Novosphingobium organovorum]